ncbi:MAG TPA: S-layer homology domain-containing protein [Candidatus Enterenecus merdae]|nr:S-layer homology domain-containing protein [Candidatus Enterenecus merdae]
MKKQMLALTVGVALLLALTTPALAAQNAPAGTVAPGQAVTADVLGLTAAAGGTVQLSAGNHVRWIDRVDLPAEVDDFYERLMEAADNDGVDDWLIDPAAYGETAAGIAGYRVAAASTVPGRLSQAEATAYLDYLWAALGAFDRDAPQVFWLSGTYTLLYAQSGGSTTFYLVLSSADGYSILDEGYSTAAQLRGAIAQRDRAVDAILADTVTTGEGEVLRYGAGAPRQENLRYFNAWLTLHNEYNTATGADPHYATECLSALTGSTGENGPVCEGYARAFKLLCDTVGIPCVLADGPSYNATGAAGGHMWNCVQMEDGGWYGVDVTWNDPVGGTQGAVSGLEREDYLLVGAQTVVGRMAFADSHVQENWVFEGGARYPNGPELSQTAYDPAGTPAPGYAVTVPQVDHGWVAASPSAAPAGATVTLTAYPDEGYMLSNLFVVDGQGERVEGVSHPDGGYTFAMPEGEVTVHAVFAPQGSDLPFRDVATVHWFYDEVRYVWDSGLMQGTGADTFGPDVTTTRAQLVTTLYRLAGQPAVAGANPFADAPAAWYADAVVWASQNGIVEGYSATQFGPEDVVTREQLAAILYRYAGYAGYDQTGLGSLAGFTDGGAVSGWARQAMTWAVGRGLIHGVGSLADPQGSATRAQLAAVLTRFCQAYP